MGETSLKGKLRRLFADLVSGNIYLADEYIDMEYRTCLRMYIVGSLACCCCLVTNSCPATLQPHGL